ncbi:MFS transporter [Caballeronia sp. LZ001]|uniref:MFS transporter n=1 Tax=Caballeronia sp. LZ001 TaxID=3038553 RepID=UPI002857B153|nr:MFS transporter [Caballeronia sp. LZ001]MDR5804834.1 MFS transporter [Caballeronia sp. LZ001]
MLMGVEGEEAVTGRTGKIGPLSRPAEMSAKRPWYLVGILVLLYLTSQLDRMIIGLLIPMIKADLHISDFQISLVQGLAFAAFFSVLGLPLGYLVDRWSRRMLIVAGVFTWSIATFSCGLTLQLGSLMLARLAVGAGEATLSPAAYSLMGDVVPHRRMGLAFSIFGMGATLGNGVGFALGGLLLTMIPPGGLALLGRHFATWQLVFMAAAIPSMLVLPLVLTFREPERRERLASESRPSLKGAFGFIAKRRGFYLPMFVAYGVFLMCALGWLSWAPTYAVRSFHRPMAQVSFTFAIFAIFAVCLSMLLIGHIIDYLGHRRGVADAHMRVLMVVSVLLGSFVILAVHASTYPAFLIAVAATFLCLGVAGVGAAIPLTTPSEYRGIVSSIYLLVSSGMGYGLGPSLVAGCTDLVFHNEARLADSLTVSMLVLSPIAALLFWLSCAPMRKAVAEASVWRKQS